MESERLSLTEGFRISDGAPVMHVLTKTRTKEGAKGLDAQAKELQ